VNVCVFIGDVQTWKLILTIDFLAIEYESGQMAILSGLDFETIRVHIIALKCCQSPTNGNQCQKRDTEAHSLLLKHKFKCLIQLGDYLVYCGSSFWHSQLRDNEKFREFVSCRC
jgi:hypothetical protein